VKLDEDDEKIICEEKITGRDFLKTTEEELRSYDMKGVPASRLADFVKKSNKKREVYVFSLR
jgi:hypothetical protein